MNVPKPKRTPPAFGVEHWHISQLRFDANVTAIAETIFNQGNGYQGIRGCLEEDRNPSGTPQGTFIAGLYERQPKQTLLMKGKKILPDDFLRAAKAFSYTHINISLEGNFFSLAECPAQTRFLNLKNGELLRHAIWQTPEGRQTELTFARFVALNDPHLAMIKLTAKPLNYDGLLRLESWIDADNICFYLDPDSWVNFQAQTLEPAGIWASASTKHSDLNVQCLATHRLLNQNQTITLQPETLNRPNRHALAFNLPVTQGHTYTLEKTIQIAWHHPQSTFPKLLNEKTADQTYANALEQTTTSWKNLWNNCDIQIEGDPAAQQGIRFSIFQLCQAYRPGLNYSVSAKGLTGEGYGQLCFWDSEIYLLPFYLYTRPELAKQILMFRYHILDHARQRAQALGLQGAAFPWMTVQGEDNPGVWECVLAEEHINAAIPYAVNHYVTVTGDQQWLADFGAEIVLENARFWASRVFFCPRRQRYVINQVTGPDEYMEMVNNNAYTNMMAAWTLEYAAKIAHQLSQHDPNAWKKLATKINLTNNEITSWSDIAEKMYRPYDDSLGIHPQDDTFLDLDQLDLAKLPPDQLPLEGVWPWPKVLRHNALKQPDVVLANFLLHDRFTPQQKKADYEFYEPKTTHDSSLSPSIHAIMAAEIGNGPHAYDYFLHAARLDLDYGNPTDGIHLANAAGAWMAIVFGFAQLRWHDNQITFKPTILAQWKSYAFSLKIQERIINIKVDPQNCHFCLETGQPIDITINTERYHLENSATAATTILPNKGHKRKGSNKDE